MTGITYLDGIATVIIGLILGATAIWLAYETKELLIWESANREIVHSIRDKTKQLSGVTHVNDVLTMHMGPEFILVNLSVDFRDGVGSEVVEECGAQLDVPIKAKYPFVKRVFVEDEARRASKGRKTKDLSQWWSG